MKKSTLLRILISILVVCFCFAGYRYILYTKKRSELRKRITNQCYFAYKQNISISTALGCCAFYDGEKVGIPTSGTLKMMYFKEYENRDPATNLIENMPYAILHRGTYIDPFISGENGVTITNWRYRQRDDWTPRSMSLRGSPLYYITDREHVFLSIYAGPDEDYDNISLNIEKVSIPDRFSFFDWPLSIIFPHNYNLSADIIEYDPTNGLISNGDIVWPIYRYDHKSWVCGL